MSHRPEIRFLPPDIPRFVCVLSRTPPNAPLTPSALRTRPRYQAVAEMIKGKSPDEIKAIFGIEGEFTEAEQKAVLEEHEWLREDPAVDPAKADEPAAGSKD